MQRGTPSDGVPALVASIREHKKFKQLANYSIECLIKVIQPPNARWRENLASAVQCGAGEAVMEVLQLHKAKEDAVTVCVGCLEKLAASPQVAEQLATTGVNTLLECVQNPPSPEVVPQCLKVLEDICSHPVAAEKAFVSGTIQTINSLMASNSDLVITAGCLRVLEKTSKSSGVMKMLVAEGGIQASMNSLSYIIAQEHNDQYMDAIFAGAKLAGRALKDSKAVADMRAVDGVSTFLKITEDCQDESVVRLSNRILTRLMGNSVEDILHNLHSPDTTPVLYQQSLSMLGTMTSNESNAKRLVEVGGLSTVVNLLQQELPANIASAVAKTVGNVAAVNAEALRESGAIDLLVHTVNAQALTLEGNAHMIEALSKACSSEVLLPEVMKKGGIDTIQQALEHADNSPALALALAQFLTGLAQSSSLELLGDGSLTAKLLDSMREAPENRQVQLEGMNALLSMTVSQTHLLATIEQGAMDVILSAMSETQEPALLQRAVQVMSAIAQTPLGHERFVGSDVLLSIAAVLDHDSNVIDLRPDIANLVQLLDSEAIVNSNVSRLLTACSNGSTATSTAEMAAEVLHAAQELRVLCVLPENAARVADIGGLDAVLSALITINGVDDVYQTHLLQNLISVLQEIADTSSDKAPESYTAITSVCVQILDEQSKNPDLVAGILRVLDVVIPNDVDQQLALDHGVVTAFTQCLSNNVTESKVLLPAAQLLLRLAEDPRLAVEIARQNCTRQLIQCLKSNADVSDERMAEALKTVVLVLDAVARHEEGNAIISKQGGVTSIFAIMDAHHTDEAFVASCVRAIDTLTSTDDVIEILRKIQASISPAHVRTANSDTLKEISREIDRLGLLLLCDDFAPVLTAEGGLDTLKAIMTAAEKVAPGPERNELLNACIKAFGRAATGQVSLEDSESLAPIVIQAVVESPTIDMMDGITSLSKYPSMCSSLITAGAINAVLHACELSSATDVVLSKASFKALSSLCLDPQGARHIVSGGGLGFVCEHISDTLYGSDISAVHAGVMVLQSLAEAASGEDLVNGSVLDVLDEVLDSVGSTSSVKAFSDVITILAKLAANPTVASKIAAHEVTKKVVRVLKSNPQYLQSEHVVSGVAELFETLAAGEHAQHTLNDIGAQHVLFDMMKLHPNKVSMLKKLAKTTSVIHGSESLSVAAFIDHIDELLSATVGEGDDVSQELTDTIAMLSNITLIDGVLEQSTTDRLVGTLTTATAMLREKQQNTSTTDCLATCLSALGKLLAVPTVKVDAELVAEAVAATLLVTPQNDAASTVVQSAVTCITGLAASSEGIAVIASTGMFAVVKRAGSRKTKVGVVNANSAAQAVTHALEAITHQAVSSATVLVGQAGGARLISEILLGMTDAKSVQSTLTQIADTEQGVGTLLQILAELQTTPPAASPKLTAALVAKLIEHREKVVIATETDVQALLHTVAVEPEAIKLINVEDSEYFSNAVIGRSHASLEQILGLLSHESSGVRLNAVAIVARLVGLNDPEVNEQLVETCTARVVMTTMKLPQEAEYLQNCLYLLYSLTQTVGFGALKLSKEVMRVVQDIVAAFPDNEYIVNMGNSLLYVLAEAFAGAAESLLEDRLRKLHVTQSAANWIEVMTDDGKVYYYNPVTQETSWEPATEYTGFLQELEAAVRLVNTLHRDLSQVDISTATCLLGAVRSHARDPTVLSKVVSILSAQANDPAQAKVIAQQITPAELLHALQFHLTQPEVLRDGMVILEKIAQNSASKDVNYLEHVTTINSMIISQSGDAVLAEQAFLTIYHLCNNDPAAIKHCAELDVPISCAMALQTHADNEAVVLAVLQLLAMLVAKSVESMQAIATSCIDQLIAIGHAYMDNVAIYGRIVRLLARLSSLDSNIVLMVRKHAIAMVSRGLQVHGSSKEIVSISVSLLNNIGAVESADDADDDEDIEAEVEQTLIDEGGVLATLASVKNYADNIEILTRGLQALYNVSNSDATELMEQNGIVELTLNSLDRFDYEKELAQQCAKLLSVLTYSESVVLRLTNFDGVRKLMQAMQTRVDDEEFLLDLLTVVANSLGNEKSLDTFEEIDGAVTFLMLMERYTCSKDIICTLLTALRRLAARDTLSSYIAEKGMHILMKELSLNLQNTTILAHTFKLFEQLVFVKSNLQILVQHGGITTLIDALNGFQADPSFLAQIVRTLENVVSADEEFTAIVIEKGGKQAVEQLKGVHTNHEELKSAIHDFFLSMNAMSRAKGREGTKVSRGALFARISGLAGAAMPEFTEKLDEPDYDPLEEFRNLLHAGHVIQDYRAGTGTVRILIMSTPEWDALLLRNPDITNKKSERHLAIRSIQEVRKGYGPGHMKKSLVGGMKSNATEEKCLYIGASNTDEDICVECNSKAERDRWLLALQQLMHVHKHWPHLLKP